MASEITIVRIYLHEADHGRRKTLMQEILNILQDQHKVKGVTVFRGIAGLDDHGEVHLADILRIVVDLPLVIEFFDTPNDIAAILPLMSGLVPEGHIISWPGMCH
jgi:PII-like signaling protein